MSQFATCRPNHKTGQVWCQHYNGAWAPPFTMQEWKKNQEVEKEETATPDVEDDGLSL